ncbi:MAG: tRNA uridine-5-carboxymethylaminomethyl(34) synthesis GTPase MnmE, partial [Lachnospiraceae bacterium]|nr:tRNA uridine-5-carboxymethylaminomethyl(34) synthesis GTPase MnmE [Lachnospiraceae bacterium]
YTGEDMVELQCHGGLYVLRRVLDAVLSAGARLAEPGEFTKRAFLNGRIDLTQAEAVMDVIAAENDFSLRNAERQISGALCERIRSLREKLLHESAFIEAALDDPESFAGELDGYADRLQTTVSGISREIDRLLSHADDGILLREGVRCAIIGRPNAGKSSLLNRMAGRDRSIVTDIPGTTRDTVEESVRIGDLTLHLIDTAGLSNVENIDDPVERIGIERAHKAAAEAELILFMIDSSEPVTDETIRLFRETEGKRRIILYNKIDIGREPDPDEICALLSEEEQTGIGGRPEEETSRIPVVCISAKTGQGWKELEEVVSELLIRDESWLTEDLIIANIRHKHLLAEAQTSLKALLQTIADGMTEDFYTVDLMSAYRALGEIIGEEVGEDLVNEIFSRFCMGK